MRKFVTSALNSQFMYFHSPLVINQESLFSILTLSGFDLSNYATVQGL